MQEVFEKIIKKLEEQIKEYDDRIERRQGACHFDETENLKKLDNRAKGIEQAIEIVKQTAAEYNNGWIPCSERLPEENKIRQPQTQADRIRSMTDEELADYIFGVSVHEKPCVLCHDDCDFCELSNEECKSKTLQWLQQEVEG